MPDINDTIFTTMKQMQGQEKLELPPKSFSDIGGRFVAYTKGESLANAFPLQERYSNPSGYLLGGYLPVFFDSTFGPFSYLETQKPTTSLDLNTTFVKPIAISEKEIYIEVFLVKKTNSFIIMDGKAKNIRGDIIATATSRLMILDPSR